MVSEFEERQAARFGMLSWPEYEERYPLDTSDGRWGRATTIAHYRADNLLNAHMTQARQADQKAQAQIKKARQQ